MKRHGYINRIQYELAINKHIDELIYKKPKNDISYDYQGYLDVVYDEVQKRFGLDPYTTPMIIETYRADIKCPFCPLEILPLALRYCITP